MNQDLVAQLPVAMSSFREIRRSPGTIYVDKTVAIASFARLKQKFFLARPRRFGKTLLVSTLESLFRNGLKDFHGLGIEAFWRDPGGFRVIRLDFSSSKNFSDLPEFKEKLARTIRMGFLRSGEELPRTGSMLEDLNAWFVRTEGSSVVLLIDEYDAPLSASLSNDSLFEKVRMELADFYALVKMNEEKLRFFFMTGIAKFNQTGIFSEFNYLTDLTLQPQYGALLGYTEEEIRSSFGPHLRHAAEVLGSSVEAVLDGLRRHYDGYCFDEALSTHVYSPWSVLRFLAAPERGFRNYWVESGGNINLLNQYLRTHALRDPLEYGQEKAVKYDDLSVSQDARTLNDVVLLTQAGYLTLKRRELDAFFVGYPNAEVAEAMAMLYAGKLLQEKSLAAVGAGGIRTAVLSADADGFLEVLNRVLLACDYVHFPVSSEAACRTVVQLILWCSGFQARAETHNAMGRSDLEFDAGSRHWVLEFKFLREGHSRVSEEREAERLLEGAVEQIRERHYGEVSPFGLFRLALVFSARERRFIRMRAV